MGICPEKQSQEQRKAIYPPKGGSLQIRCLVSVTRKLLDQIEVMKEIDEKLFCKNILSQVTNLRQLHTFTFSVTLKCPTPLSLSCWERMELYALSAGFGGLLIRTFYTLRRHWQMICSYCESCSREKILQFCLDWVGRLGIGGKDLCRLNKGDNEEVVTFVLHYKCKICEERVRGC